eukprot:3157693-Alexandrium_andersonii.AAC.1
MGASLGLLKIAPATVGGQPAVGHASPALIADASDLPHVFGPSHLVMPNLHMVMYDLLSMRHLLMFLHTLLVMHDLHMIMYDLLMLACGA